VSQNSKNPRPTRNDRSVLLSGEGVDNLRCEQIKTDGKRCGAQALIGERLCGFHADPNWAAQVGMKGGRRRARFSLERLKQFRAPHSVNELAAIVSQTLVDVRAERIDPKTAAVISSLASSLYRIFEGSDLERRIERLEDQQHRKGNHGQP